jgi:hypothetical protein
MFTREKITLVVEPDVIRLLSVERGRVTRCGSAPLPRGVVHDGYVTNEASFAQVVQRLWGAQSHEKPMPRDNVILAIPGQHAQYQMAPLSAEEQKLGRLNLKAEGLIPDPLTYRAWQVVGSKATPALFVVAAPVEQVNGFVSGLQAAGVGVAAVDVKTLALIRAVGCQQTVIVDCERDQGAVIIVNEALLHQARFPVLDAPLLAGAEDKITRLVETLANAIRSFNVEFPAYALQDATPIFLTGLLSEHSLLREAVEEVLGHPIGRVAFPFTVPPDMPLAQFAANLGLAQKRI